MTKIAVFGSAFNPPSLGHKSVIESLTHFDKILLLPSIAHAWGKQMLDYEIRCQLVNEFIQDLGLQQLELSTVEEDLFQPGESVTTFAVLTEIQRNNPNADITFVVGPDNLFKFGQFFQAEQILHNWSVIACPEKVNIRSTDIRTAIKQGKSIFNMTTPRVAQYIQRHKLFS
ncbi:nicotinate-nicotinamide nucleotide adenylyltransferase [Vibrio sp.]|uniref:nicotinate-nicotinamide nucleotide adenylyltransferase n=1 Tax=Vibrio sp. TaxID=678 RepID=UPI003D13BBE1